MSYILDALKKAERDRRRPRVPTLATIHVVAAKPRWPIWWWVVAGVLVVNVGVVAVTLYSRQTAAVDASASKPSRAEEPARPDATPAPRVATPAAAPAPSPAPAARVAKSHPGAAETPSVTAKPSATPAETSRATPPDGAPVARASVPSASPGARRQSSEMNLDVLVYSSEPAERAAYINGLRYAEGQRVDGRFVVERIVEDGVVLRGDGKSFTLKQHK